MSRNRTLRRALVALPLLAFATAAAAQQPRGLEPPHMDWGTTSFVLLDQLEIAPGAEDNPLALAAMGWWGSAYNRVWFRTEGEQFTGASGGEGEAEILYGRMIAPFWDALAGVRLEGRWGDDSDTRAHLSVGLEGLAPYWFELAPTLFVSQDGDVSARLEAEYELLFTQRLVLSPEVELNAAVQEVPEWGIGSGLNDYEFGLRLRYEIKREFAPYVGYEWRRRVGGTANFARAASEEVSSGSWVAGLRLWY
jgi:copper resistance protein B